MRRQFDALGRPGLPLRPGLHALRRRRRPSSPSSPWPWCSGPAGCFVLGGDLSIGELVAFNGLVVLANGPVGTLLRLWDELQYASVLLGRLDDVLAQEPEQGEDHSHLQPVPVLSGRVSIQHLTVRTQGPVRRRRSSTTSRSRSSPARPSPSSGAAVPARQRSCAASLGLQPATSGRILYDGVDLDTPRPPPTAPPHRLRPPGRPPVRRHPGRQHRPGRGGGRPRAGAVGGPGGRRRRVHRAPAPRLRAPASARRASGSPAGRPSGSRSPAPSTAGRRS